jgi:hypothetical protein
VESDREREGQRERERERDSREIAEKSACVLEKQSFHFIQLGFSVILYSYTLACD